MRKYILLLFLIVLSINYSFAQLTLPYVFENNSRYDDDEIYIGLVGKMNPTGDVWMDMSTSTLEEMSSDLNTVDGPEWSHPTDWKYPDIFTKLSDINNNTIQIPHGLYGCRIFISFESPMYLRFHATGGYAGANLSSDSDPNDGIRWEIVELTWGSSGLWTNTSRVDAYQYPMAIEVTGHSGGVDTGQYETYYNNITNSGVQPELKRIGEVLPHDEILEAWDNSVSNDYLVAKIVKTHSIDGEPIIEQPSKVPSFPEDVLDDYIDDIWSTYSNHDLVINIGDRGTWSGRVNSNDEFEFTDPVDGSTATIYGKPSSFDAIEGAGFLAYTPISAAVNLEQNNEDLMIQAQITAAITRHAIYTNITNGAVQYSHDASRFFQIAPYNEYVKFFHDEAISFESQTYAFAYDDVGDHSSTIQSTFPTNVKVIIGGYGESPTTSSTFPDPNKTYYIDSPIHDLRIAATGESAKPYTTDTSETGTNVAWKFVPKGNGHWHIQLAVDAANDDGTSTRLRTDNNLVADMQNVKWNGTYTYFELTEGFTEGTYFVTLPDGPTNHKRLQVDSAGVVKMVSTASNRTWESFTFTEASNTSNGTSLFVEAEDYSDMKGIQTQPCDEDDTLNVGWIDATDWMDYTVNIPSSGNYTLNLRVASPNDGASVQVQANGNTINTSIPNTSNWQNWTTVTTESVNLSAGVQTIRLYSPGNGWNINWLEIVAATASKSAIEEDTVLKVNFEETKLYPNPVTDQLNISLGNYEVIKSITIINMNGQVISSKSVDTNIITFNTRNLSNGLYLVKIASSDGSITIKKFIK